MHPKRLENSLSVIARDAVILIAFVTRELPREYVQAFSQFHNCPTPCNSRTDQPRADVPEARESREITLLNALISAYVMFQLATVPHYVTWDGPFQSLQMPISPVPNGAC